MNSDFDKGRTPESPDLQDRTPLVSIITPYFNVEKFIGEAIDSVFAQSYENWELILVDDGSTDESSRIAHRYREKAPEKITCVEHQGRVNKGTSVSRNVGLSYARGEYVTFLDADDVWMPEKLSHQLDLACNHPDAALICGASHYWGAWNGDLRRDRVVYVGCEQNRLYNPPELLKVLYPLGNGNAPSMNGLLIKKAVIDDFGGFVDDFTGMYDDQVLLSKVYLEHRVYVSDFVYDKYRLRPGSICDSASGKSEYGDSRIMYLRWLVGYLSERGVHDKEIHALARMALMKYEAPLKWRFRRRSSKLFRRMGGLLKRLRRSGPE